MTADYNNALRDAKAFGEWAHGGGLPCAPLKDDNLASLLNTLPYNLSTSPAIAAWVEGWEEAELMEGAAKDPWPDNVRMA